MIAEEAGHTLKSRKGFLGRTALQKIVYFLQVCRVPMKYRFDVHHYGPFCSQILSDVDWLEANNVVVDSSDSTRFSNYRIGKNGSALVKAFADDVEPFREAVRRIVSVLVPMELTQLELYSTLHYAYRELKFTRSSTPSKDEVIERFRKFKDDKFDSKRIVDAYECLVEAGLLDQSS